MIETLFGWVYILLVLDKCEDARECVVLLCVATNSCTTLNYFFLGSTWKLERYIASEGTTTTTMMVNDVNVDTHRGQMIIQRDGSGEG